MVSHRTYHIYVGHILKSFVIALLVVFICVNSVYSFGDNRTDTVTLLDVQHLSQIGSTFRIYVIHLILTQMSTFALMNEVVIGRTYNLNNQCRTIVELK